MLTRLLGRADTALHIICRSDEDRPHWSWRWLCDWYDRRLLRDPRP